jgi:hypothetical protein
MVYEIVIGFFLQLQMNIKCQKLHICHWYKGTFTSFKFNAKTKTIFSMGMIKETTSHSNFLAEVNINLAEQHLEIRFCAKFM